MCSLLLSLPVILFFPGSWLLPLVLVCWLHALPSIFVSSCLIWVTAWLCWFFCTTFVSTQVRSSSQFSACQCWLLKQWRNVITADLTKCSLALFVYFQHIHITSQTISQRCSDYVTLSISFPITYLFSRTMNIAWFLSFKLFPFLSPATIILQWQLLVSVSSCCSAPLLLIFNDIIMSIVCLLSFLGIRLHITSLYCHLQVPAQNTSLAYISFNKCLGCKCTDITSYHFQGYFSSSSLPVCIYLFPYT